MQVHFIRQDSIRWFAVLATVSFVLIAGWAGIVTVTGSAYAASDGNGVAQIAENALMVERVNAINRLRAQNAEDFNAMEQAPGIYTNSHPVHDVQAKRLETIVLLRQQNVDLFDAMEAAPGLYTAR